MSAKVKGSKENSDLHINEVCLKRMKVIDLLKQPIVYLNKFNYNSACDIENMMGSSERNEFFESKFEKEIHIERNRQRENASTNKDNLNLKVLTKSKSIIKHDFNTQLLKHLMTSNLDLISKSNLGNTDRKATIETKRSVVSQNSQFTNGFKFQNTDRPTNLKALSLQNFFKPSKFSESDSCTNNEPTAMLRNSNKGRDIINRISVCYEQIADLNMSKQGDIIKQNKTEKIKKEFYIKSQNEKFANCLKKTKKYKIATTQINPFHRRNDSSQNSLPVKSKKQKGKIDSIIDHINKKCVKSIIVNCKLLDKNKDVVRKSVLNQRFIKQMMEYGNDREAEKRLKKICLNFKDKLGFFTYNENMRGNFSKNKEFIEQTSNIIKHTNRSSLVSL